MLAPAVFAADTASVSPDVALRAVTAMAALYRAPERSVDEVLDELATRYGMDEAVGFGTAHKRPHRLVRWTILAWRRIPNTLQISYFHPVRLRVHDVDLIARPKPLRLGEAVASATSTTLLQIIQLCA